MLPLMNRPKHSNVSYTPIDTAESDSLLLDSESPDRNAIPLTGPARTRKGFYFFLVSCTIALTISACNLTFLSATNSYQLFATSKPSRAPSVYMGLENLPPDTSVCRSRMTFPKQFATFREDNVNDMTPVHAPGDKMSLSFGGEVRRSYIYHMTHSDVEASCRFRPMSAIICQTTVLITVPSQSNLSQIRILFIVRTSPSKFGGYQI